MEQLFKDLKAYEKGKRWMWFELFIRQPVSLCGLAYFLVSSLLAGDQAVRSWLMIIILSAWIVLAVMTLARNRYSYPSWIALLVLQTIASVMNTEISFWSVLIQEIILALLILYYNKRKDFFYKEVSDAETGANGRKWEIELVVLIHLILAFCLHYSLGSMLRIRSMTIYENERLALQGWFLYGGGLYLALGWEKITRKRWWRTALGAAGMGIAAAAARAALDYNLNMMVLDSADRKGTMRTSLLITGAFCLILIMILFMIFTKERKLPLKEAWIPMAVMAFIAIFYLAEYVYSCGWVGEKEDLDYARQGVLPMYVWSMSYFLTLFWVALRMRRVKRGIEG